MKEQFTYKGNLTRLSADLLEATLQTRREWQEIIKVLKEGNLQPKILYSARLSFIIEGEIGFPRQARTPGAHHH